MVGEFRFELDDLRSEALECEADRLGLETGEVARRAVSAWLMEIADESPCPHVSALEGLTQA